MGLLVENVETGGMADNDNNNVREYGIAIGTQ
jgi:hypothetical protein